MPSTDSATLNRREASIKLLRLKGVAAGTADVGFWLSEHSQHPEPELAINLKLSRRSLSRAHPERPTGGNLDDLLIKKTLVAGTDPVALDAYVAKAYWNLEVSSLPYLKMESQRGLGTCEFGKIRTRARSSGRERKVEHYELPTIQPRTSASQLESPANSRLAVTLHGTLGRTVQCFCRPPSAASGEDNLCGSLLR
ncbi:MAG: hypothetical protein WBP73_08755 [Terriglobales bacterium]